MKIKSIYVDQIGRIKIGNPSIYNNTYDKIEYEMNEEMYRCYLNEKIVREYNKRFVVSVEYD